MTDTKPDVWLHYENVEPWHCDKCGQELLPNDWLTQEGCCYCDAGLDLLTPWGAT